MGLEAIFRAAVRQNGKKTAVVNKRQRITYQNLDIRSTRIGGVIRDILGVEQKKVLILAHNSIPVLEVILGCFKVNAVACPINWRLSPYELSTILQQEKFELIFYDKETCTTLHQALDLCEIQITKVRLGGLKYQSMMEFLVYDQRQMEEDVRRNIGDIAIQYFTSGTTGIPKGVLLTHESLRQYFESYTRCSGWDKDDVYQTSANLFHLSGFSALISLLLGNTLVLMDRFDLYDFLDTMEREHTTRVSLVPTLITNILHCSRFSEYDFSSVRKIVYGGATMLPAQIEEASKRLSCQLEIAYGTTETCCISALTAEDHQRILMGVLPEEKLLSVGKPLPEVAVRICDQDGKEMETGEKGEITVKSLFLYQGYSNAAAAPALDADGYHHTGDIGFRDADGYVYIVDRKHDMIVCGGENIYPKEVEICISKMANCVRQVGVVGKADPVWGEIVVAFVVRQRGASVTEEDIISFCKHNIASYKKPKKVVFLEEMPLNSNGKIDKQALRAML